MYNIQLKLEDNGRGAFVIEEGDERLAEMAVAITKDNLTVFHTQVNDKLKGQGIASQLLSTMVEYVKKNKLKVIALCPYVSAQFQRRPDQYADIWNQTWHK